MALFPEGRALPVADSEVVQIRLGELALRRPRQWGGCWLAGALWDQLHLDGFWSARLSAKRDGGATIDEISKATDWQAHSVRGAISGAIKKKLGLTVETEVVEDRGRVYRITGTA